MFRSTIVHRFLIKATIEERMQTMLKTVDRRYVLNFLNTVTAMKLKRRFSAILLQLGTHQKKPPSCSPSNSFG